MLKIKGLKVAVEGKEILKGINLEIGDGEVHAIMGPNGSGKSTLSNALTGREGYEITDGTVSFNGENLLDFSPEERARMGIFMSFQYPVEIPGVSMSNFLKASVNAQREYRGLSPLTGREFFHLMKGKQKLLHLDSGLTNRSVNEGFSGGEKKKNEIFQMAILDPSLAIMDETDSGLDIDALRVVAEGVNTLKSPHNSIILITHYQRLLEYIVPDFVHVLYQGRIVKSAGKELAKELEERGYDWIKKEVADETGK